MLIIFITEIILLVSEIQNSIIEAEKSLNQYNAQKPKDKKRKRNKPLYATPEVWVNANTFVVQHCDLSPLAMKMMLIFLKKKQNRDLFCLDDRLIRGMFHKPYARSSVQKAWKELRDKGLVITTEVSDFDEYKEAFDIPMKRKSRLIRVMIPNYLKVKNETVNKIEREARSIIGAVLDKKPQEVNFNEIVGYAFNYNNLKNKQINHHVHFFAHHICYGRYYRLLIKQGLDLSKFTNLTLQHFPFTTKSNKTVVNKLSKTELRSASIGLVGENSEKYFLNRKRGKGSFASSKDLSQVHRIGVSQIVSDYPHEDPFETDEEFVTWLHEVFFNKKVPLSHCWGMVTLAKATVLLHHLVEDGFEEYMHRFQQVFNHGELLSSVIGYSDFKVDYIESRIVKGGKFGILPEAEQLEMGDILQGVTKDVISEGVKEKSVGRVKSKRLAKMNRFEENGLVEITTRRQRAEVESKDKKLKNLAESEAPEVNKAKEYERIIHSKTAKQVSGVFAEFDFETGGNPNLTRRGVFMKFLLYIQAVAKEDKWHKSWKWIACRKYYHREMLRMNPNFKSDAVPRDEKDFQTRNRIGVTKKAMDKFNFVEWMEMLYYCMFESKELYAFGFFSGEFRLTKMNKYDRLTKIFSIMDKSDFWDDRRLVLESIESNLSSEETAKEDRVQAVAQLSDIEKAELLTLEKEVKSANGDYLRLSSEVDELEEEIEFLNRYTKAYNRITELYNTEEEASQALKDQFSEVSRELPEPSKAKGILEQLKVKLEATELEMSDCLDTEAKEARIKELLNETN